MENDDAHQMPTCLDRVKRARRKHCVLCLSPFVFIAGILQIASSGAVLRFYASGPLGSSEISLDQVGESKEDGIQIRVVQPPPDLPTSLDTSVPGAFWTTWSNPEVDPFRRAINPSFYLAAPEGGFFLEIFPARVREPGASPRTTFLCFFAFDPRRKADFDWMAGLDERSRQAIRILREKSLLTGQQQRQMDEQRTAFENRYARMLEAWQAFAVKPREASGRQVFFRALSHVQPTNDFRPEKFCSSSQRSQLRGEGMTITGFIRHDGYADGVSSHLYRFKFIGYPLSQLISDWNSGRILKYPGAMTTPEPRTTIFLRARSDRQHDEIPADFEIIDDVFLDPVARQDRILEKLLTIEGVRKTADPDRDVP